jgi:predicted transcriptional regulator
MGITVGIELPDELLRRIEKEAERRGISREDLCREALAAWFPTSDVENDPEFQEQLRIAREGMRRYRDTLRELAS